MRPSTLTTVLFLTFALSGPLMAQASFWQPSTGPLGAQVNCLTIDPEGTVYLGTANLGVFRSTNDGGTWTSIAPTQFFSALALTRSTIIGGTDNHGIVRSTDGGASWDTVRSGITRIDFFALNRAPDGSVLAGSDTGIVFRSTDDGLGWSALPGYLGPYRIYDFAFKPGGLVFAASLGAGVYVSPDDGGSWSQRIAGLTNTTVRALAVSATGEVYAGTDGGLFRSTNDGVNWSAVTVPWTAPITDLVFSSVGDLFAATKSGVYQRTNGGSAWTNVSSGLAITNTGPFAVRGDGSLYLGTYGGGVSLSKASVTPLHSYEYQPDEWTLLLMHFNELTGIGAYDAGPWNNNGSAMGAGLLSGRFGNARSFNGSGQFVDLPETPSLAPPSSGTNYFFGDRLTAEAWVYLNSYPAPGAGNHIVSTNNQNDYDLSVNGDGRLEGHLYLSSGPGAVVGSRTIPLGKWTHVALAYDGSAARFYVNGVLDATIPRTGTIGGSPQSENVTIGGYLSYGQWFNGLIDEVRISKVARTPEEFNVVLPPRNLAAIVSGTSIVLNWSAGSGIAPVGYKIYRGADSSSMVYVGSSTTTGASDAGLVPGNRYYYRVSAVDLTGFEGEKSYAAGVIAPSHPLEYQPDGNTVVLLHMNEAAGNAVGDASAAGNHGTSDGPGIVAGRYGSARSFDGLNDYAYVADSPSLRPSQVTVEAWVYSDNYANIRWMIIASKELTSGSFSFRLQMYGTSRRVYFGTGISQDFGIASDAALNNGEWYHVAGTFDGNTLRVYVNGVLEGEKSQPGVLPYNGDPLLIGKDTDNISYWTGVIDELRISRTAKVPSEFNVVLPPKAVAANPSGSGVSISWSYAGMVPANSFKVYRGTDSLSMALLGSTASLVFDDASGTPGERYYYRVSAVDPTGFEGRKSVAASATAPDPYADYWVRTNGPGTTADVRSFLENAQGHMLAGVWYAGTNGQWGVYRTTDRGEHWEIISDLGHPGMDMCMDSRGHIYACVYTKGIKKSTDHGVTWALKNNGLTNLGARDCIIDRQGRIFVSTENGLFRSTDEGGSWQLKTTGLLTLNTGHMVIDSSGAMILGTLAGTAYRSTNGGDSWYLLRSDLGYPGPTFAVHQTGVVYMTGPGTIFRSTDNGHTWTPSKTGLPWPGMSLAINALGHIFAGGMNPTGLLLSTDNGDSWVSAAGGLPPSAGVIPLFVDREGYVYAGTNGDGVYRTKYSTVPFRAVPLSVRDNCGGNAALSLGLSADGSENIDITLGERELPPPPPLGIFDARFVLPGSPPVSSLKDYRSDTSRVATWKVLLQSGACGYPLTVEWGNVVAFPGTLFLRDEITGAIVNVDMKSVTSFTLTNAGITSLKIEYTSTHVASIAVQQGWNIVSVPLNAPDMTASTVFPDASSLAYGYQGAYVAAPTLAVGKGYWLKFPAAGSVDVSGMEPAPPEIPLTAGWQMIGPLSRAVSTSALSTVPPGIIAGFFYGYEGGYREATSLTPGKGYWVKATASGVLSLAGGLAKSAVEPAVESAPPVVVAFRDADGTGGEVYLSEGGAHGAELPPPPPLGIPDVRFSGNTATELLGGGSHEVVLTSLRAPITISASGLGDRRLRVRDAHSGEILNADLRDGHALTLQASLTRLLIIDSGTANELPEAYALEQNYPNPFNPSTVFRFALPEDAKVTLAIYNVLGQQVGVPVNEPLLAGYHEVAFTNPGLATGVYLYRLEAGSFVQTRKMIIMK